jgi:lipoprotein-anchoring transpeptidase ErfK/SrfK
MESDMRVDRRAFLSLTATAAAAVAVPARAQTALGMLDTEPFDYVRYAESEIPAEFRRQLVPYVSNETTGTLIVDPGAKFLYVTREEGMALRYGIGVGREGFSWSGRARIGRKAAWPTWTPPEEMRLRQPELPESMPGGPENPLGARALYLFEGNRDTLYRLHGTSELHSIGQAVSSGCVRLLNQDIVDLYRRVPVGTDVVVLAADGAIAQG